MQRPQQLFTSHDRRLCSSSMRIRCLAKSIGLLCAACALIQASVMIGELSDRMVIPIDMKKLLGLRQIPNLEMTCKAQGVYE